MAMFFFLSGLFVWPRLRHKAPHVFIRDRLLRLGTALCDRRRDDHTDRVLCDLPEAPTRPRLRGVLVENGYCGPLAQRADLVRLGVAGVRPYGNPALPALAWAAGPDKPDVAARLQASRPVLPVSRWGHRVGLHSGAGLFWTQPLVRVRAVLGPGQPCAALRGLFFHRSRRRRGEFRSRPAWRERQVGKQRMGLGCRRRSFRTACCGG